MPLIMKSGGRVGEYLTGKHIPVMVSVEVIKCKPNKEKKMILELKYEV